MIKSYMRQGVACVNKFIVTKSDNTKSEYNLIDFEIQVNSKNLVLSLVCEAETFTYNIRTDIREDKMTLILSFILEQIDGALNNDKDFIVREYLERQYIFIGDVSTCCKQYSINIA